MRRAEDPESKWDCTGCGKRETMREWGRLTREEYQELKNGEMDATKDYVMGRRLAWAWVGTDNYCRAYRDTWLRVQRATKEEAES